MAYISFQPSDFFNNKLYTGGSGFTAFTGVGFQPDMTWHKDRTSSVSWWGQCDSVRGVNTGGKDCVALYSNDASAQGTDTTSYLNGYQSDGFTAGNNGSFGSEGVTYIASCWKAGTTTGITGSPSITPTEYSFNATSGFSIVEFTGDGTSGATLPHGLGKAPGMIIVKHMTAAENWCIYHSAMGNTKTMYLNTQASEVTNAKFWNNTSPTSTLFSVGNGHECNGTGDQMIAYCFADVKGYSKFGSYTGNSNADGSFIYTGFRPAFIMVKRYDSGSEDWNMWNDKVLGYNVDNNKLLPNLTSAESTSDEIDLLSNGFKWRTTNGGLNASGGSYIYMAFAEFPFVSSNSKAGTAR